MFVFPAITVFFLLVIFYISDVLWIFSSQKYLVKVMTLFLDKVIIM